MTTTDDTTTGEDAFEPDEAFADFDAFFAEEGPALDERDGMPFTLYGRRYRLPSRLPGLVALQLQRMKQSQRPEDVRAVLGALVGPDAIDHWAEHSMSDRRFSIVLGWALANTAKPGSLSLDEAAARYDAREAERGKATPPAKTAAKKKPAAKKKTAKRTTSGARS